MILELLKFAHICNMLRKGEKMKIAVTYDNGNVFQHFGKTETFKVYEIVDNKVVETQEVATNGTGHGALAGFLEGMEVNIVICGGLGDGALNALTEAGIEVVSGAEGDTDEAVAAYLVGNLQSTGVNCDHHEHHHEEEECDCGGGCGGSCGGCGGGCGGGMQISLEGKNAGKVCRVHYKGTFNDGTQFDSSYDRGEPIEFICGAGQMINGFDMAVVDMEIGQEKDIHLMPEEAYGQPDPRAIFSLEIAKLPGSENAQVGQQVYLADQYGQPVPVKVVAKDEVNITFDANHEMAGKELNFHIELVEVK